MCRRLSMWKENHISPIHLLHITQLIQRLIENQ
jgi:hypothetical protein